MGASHVLLCEGGSGLSALLVGQFCSSHIIRTKEMEEDEQEDKLMKQKDSLVLLF